MYFPFPTPVPPRNNDDDGDDIDDDGGWIKDINSHCYTF